VLAVEGRNVTPYRWWWRRVDVAPYRSCCRRSDAAPLPVPTAEGGHHTLPVLAAGVINPVPRPVEHRRALITPTFTPTRRKRRSKRKLWMIVGAVAIVLAAVFAFVFRPQSGPAAGACGQNVLPFNGLTFRLSPGGVAVDSAGAVYVTNQGMFRPGGEIDAGLGHAGGASVYRPVSAAGSGCRLSRGGVRHRLQPSGRHAGGRIE